MNPWTVRIDYGRAELALRFPQHPNQHRPERPVLLAVDQQLGEGMPTSTARSVRSSSQEIRSLRSLSIFAWITDRIRAAEEGGERLVDEVIGERPAMGGSNAPHR